MLAILVGHRCRFFSWTLWVSDTACSNTPAWQGLRRGPWGLRLLLLDILMLLFTALPATCWPGFTNMCKSVAPDDVMEFINLLFGRFDELCLQYNSYKVSRRRTMYIEYTEPRLVSRC